MVPTFLDFNSCLEPSVKHLNPCNILHIYNVGTSIITFLLSWMTTYIDMVKKFLDLYKQKFKFGLELANSKPTWVILYIR
jgi:hypothetical protein